MCGADEKAAIRIELGDGSDSRGPLSQGSALNCFKLLETGYAASFLSRIWKQADSHDADMKYL